MSLWMNEMTWVEYEREVIARKPPVFLPVGALEQHGPHLPLGTDALLATAVARDAAAKPRSPTTSSSPRPRWAASSRRR